MYLAEICFDPDDTNDSSILVCPTERDAEAAILAELNESEVLTEEGGPFTSYKDAIERCHEVVTWRISPLVAGQFTRNRPFVR